MKKYLMLLLFAFALAPAAHALELEVVPLAVKAKSDVIGMQSAMSGDRAIVFTGKAAKNLARAAGQSIDTRRQMIIATGPEVDRLITAHDLSIAGMDPIRNTLIIDTRGFVHDAIKLAIHFIQKGGSLAFHTAEEATQTALEVVKSLAHAAQHTVIWVTDTGIQVVEIGARVIGKVLNLACRAFEIIAIDLGCSQ